MKQNQTKTWTWSEVFLLSYYFTPRLSQFCVRGVGDYYDRKNRKFIKRIQVIISLRWPLVWSRLELQTQHQSHSMLTCCKHTISNYSLNCRASCRNTEQKPDSSSIIKKKHAQFYRSLLRAPWKKTNSYYLLRLHIREGEHK